MADEWRPVEGAPEYRAYRDGRIWSSYRGRFLTMTSTVGGNTKKYALIGMKYGLERRVIRTWHGVIWSAFNGQPKPGQQIRFRDGNVRNCALSNLYIYKQRVTILTPAQLDEIHAAYAAGATGYSLTVKYGISLPRVRSIIGPNWRGRNHGKN